MTENEIKIIHIPDPQESDFPNKETFDKAMESMNKREFVSNGSIMLIPDAKVIACFRELVSAATPLGLGFLQPGSQLPFTHNDALLWWEQSTSLVGHEVHFDYVVGRPIKMSFSYDPATDLWETDTRLYDRDHGVGAGEHIISQICAS
jgi:hypothetical protein